MGVITKQLSTQQLLSSLEQAFQLVPMKTNLNHSDAPFAYYPTAIHGNNQEDSQDQQPPNERLEQEVPHDFPESREYDYDYQAASNQQATSHEGGIELPPIIEYGSQGDMDELLKLNLVLDNSVEQIFPEEFIPDPLPPEPESPAEDSQPPPDIPADGADSDENSSDDDDVEVDWGVGQDYEFEGEDLFYDHYYLTPIVFDLDGDGIEFIAASHSQVTVADGHSLFQMGWISGEDGFLVFDYNRDNQVTELDELAFSSYHMDAYTDLQGLQLVFDTNQDFKLNNQDEYFKDFGVWQDKNENGITELGEFNHLIDLGVTELDLSALDYLSQESGNLVFAQGHYSLSDGSSFEYFDVALSLEEVFYGDVSPVNSPVSNFTVPALTVQHAPSPESASPHPQEVQNEWA